MNNVEDNYFGDVNRLVQGYSPRIGSLYVYKDEETGDDKNGFHDQCFSVKAVSLRFLRTSSVM